MTRLPLLTLDETGIDGRKRTEALSIGERRLLEMVASGSPLSDVLGTLCLLVEQSAGGCMCSVLLVDPSHARLQHGAAPSLPSALNTAIHNRPVIPYWGPCAMAVDQKIQVIVSDVAVDTRWESFEWCNLALDSGLRSCWTTPILSRAGEALGTFAIYQHEAGSPAPLHQRLIEQFTHIASIAIEQAQSDAALSRARSELARMTRVSAQDQAELAVLRERRAALGGREREVMDLVVSGLLNKQIAARLGISEITVKAHRGKVMRKMQAASLADLVRMAARLGLPLGASADTFV